MQTCDTSSKITPPPIDTLTVLVPFYNEKDYLPDMLESILKQTRKPDKILLIDNVSTDNSAELARQILDRQDIPFEIIPEEKRGPVFGYEHGMADVQTELLMFANADTYYPPHYIQLAGELFNENKDICCLLALDEDKLEKMLNFAGKHPKKCFAGAYGQIVRVKAMREAGGYSHKIWPYVLADHEFVHRMSKQGKLGYNKNLWNRTSSRRTSRKNVRWNLFERILYRNLPDCLMDWFFYKFLWKRFAKRNLYTKNLREQPWSKGK
jgi:glycosyltransferase involved in cell wall biosynthesis